MGWLARFLNAKIVTTSSPELSWRLPGHLSEASWAAGQGFGNSATRGNPDVAFPRFHEEASDGSDTEIAGVLSERFDPARVHLRRRGHRAGARVVGGARGDEEFRAHRGRSRCTGSQSAE